MLILEVTHIQWAWFSVHVLLELSMEQNTSWFASGQSQTLDHPIPKIDPCAYTSGCKKEPVVRMATTPQKTCAYLNPFGRNQDACA